ncbi:IS4 transposase [Escherichia coli]|nr:IS4 transposase [Escherichia coli]
MYRVKQLFGGSLTLRDYDGQVAEGMVMVRIFMKGDHSITSIEIG